MINVFSVGVTVQLVDRMSAGLAAIGRGMIKNQGQLDQFHGKLRAMQDNFRAGVTLIQDGFRLAAPLMHAADKAANLELAIKRVQIATQAGAHQMQGFSDILAQVANQTAVFSMPKIAELAAEMAASGIREMSDIKALLPQFAKAADLIKVVGHSSPTQTVHTLSALAHQFGRYTPKEMEPIIEAVTALAPVLPGGPRGFATMGGYVNILGNRLYGLDPVKLLTLQAAAMQAVGGGGAGARGPLSGSAIMNMLSRQIPGVFGSGLFSGKSAFALRVMGFADEHGKSTVFEHGKMSREKMFNQLMAFYALTQDAAGRIAIAQRMLNAAPMLGKKGVEMIELGQYIQSSKGNIAPAELSAKLFRYAFGASDRAAAIFGDPKFQEAVRFLDQKVARFRKSGGIEAAQEDLLGTTSMQFARMKTNAESLQTLLGQALLPRLKQIYQTTGDLLDRARQFIAAHPRVRNLLVTLALIAPAAMVIAGGFMVLRAVMFGLEATTILLKATLFSTRLVILLVRGSMLALRAAMVLMNPVIAGIVAAIGLLAYDIANWDHCMHAWRQTILASKVWMLDITQDILRGIEVKLLGMAQWVNSVFGGLFKVDINQAKAAMRGLEAMAAQEKARTLKEQIADQRAFEASAKSRSSQRPALDMRTILGTMNIVAPNGHPETLKKEIIKGLDEHNKRKAQLASRSSTPVPAYAR